MLFNDLKGLICPLYYFVGQVVALLIANLQMFVKIVSEVVELLFRLRLTTL